MKSIRFIICAAGLALTSLRVLADAPNITSQPISAVVAVGQPASLGVANAGVGTFSYQWLKDGVILSGQTNPTLAFASFQFTNSGSYQVVITNTDGLAISFPASLSVPNAPLRVWGYYGFGNGTTATTNLPTQVASNVVTMAGALHTMFVKADGSLWAVGLNGNGQLGSGSTTTNQPTQVASNAVTVTTGIGHTLFVKADGSLWVMGLNADGQLGNGSTVSVSRPTQVASNVVAVAAGYNYSLFVKADGSLWAMGNNVYGQLGNGSTVSATRPMQVASNVVNVAAGSGHTLFLKVDGSLWAMGYNNYGQLGNGTTNSCKIPIQVTNNVVAVAAGNSHTLFVKADGTLWAMGANDSGQLGNGSTINTNRPILVTNSVVTAAAGGGCTLFVKADGTLWAMGANGTGQLGNGSMLNTNRPVLVNGGGLIAASLANAPLAMHSMAIAVAKPIVTLLSDQTVNLGQSANLTASVSGDGPFTYQWQLNGTNLVDATNTSYTTIADAGDYRLVVTSPYASTIGANVRGTTVFITSQPVSTVVGLGQPASLNVTNGGIGPFSYQWLKDGMILAGQTNRTLAFGSFQFTNSGSYNVVIANGIDLTISVPVSLSISNASLRVWGNNSNWQLGNGSTINTNRPILVTNNVVTAAAGIAHTLFVEADGTLWAMGNNAFGQLGNGSTAFPNRPMQVASNVVAVATGSYHSLFVKVDGSLWVMGNNNYGQLGVGTTNSSKIPIQVASNVVTVAAGYAYSLFVKSDGSLWGMGDNSYGQLGDGSTVSQTQPVLITNNVVTVAAGYVYSLFVKSDSSLWGMGDNSFGQLGDSSTVSCKRPILITNNVVTMAAGVAHTLFLKTDGTLWGMGTNINGQLGNGTTFSTNRPIFVTNGVAAVSAGAMHSLFAKADGTLWAMGANIYGQLGDGTKISTNRPVLVNGGGLLVAGLAKEVCANHSLAVAYSVVEGLTSQTVNLGQPTSFRATTVGDGPYTYQWKMNGTSLVNATNADYHIASAALTDAGIYSVFVTNPFGSGSISASLIVNTEPTANALTMGALTSEPQKLKIIGGAHPPFDADGDTLAVSAVTQGTNGATVTQDGVSATYTSASLFIGADRFDYVVVDGRGGFATNTVTVTVISHNPNYNQLAPTLMIANGAVSLTYAGIPYGNYALDWATNLIPPIGWLPLVTNLADAGGVLILTNSPDPAINNFWRIRAVP